jgi:hypothetical protein
LDGSLGRKDFNRHAQVHDFRWNGNDRYHQAVDRENDSPSYVARPQYAREDMSKPEGYHKNVLYDINKFTRAGSLRCDKHHQAICIFQWYWRTSFCWNQSLVEHIIDFEIVVINGHQLRIRRFTVSKSPNCEYHVVMTDLGDAIFNEKLACPWVVSNFQPVRGSSLCIRNLSDICLISEASNYVQSMGLYWQTVIEKVTKYGSTDSHNRPLLSYPLYDECKIIGEQFKRGGRTYTCIKSIQKG